MDEIMSTCTFSIDGLRNYAEAPVATASIKGNQFFITFSTAYCANDQPAPTLRWQFTWNARPFSIACRIVNNVKGWVYENLDKDWCIVDLESAFQNSQTPVLAFCDEYGTQYHSHLCVRGTLQFAIQSQSPATLDDGEVAANRQ